MKCRQAAELFNIYFEGGLDRSRTRELMEHAAACQDCRREMDMLGVVFDGLGSQTASRKVRESFTKDIMSVIEKGSKRPVNLQNGAQNDYRPVYRRLGFSLIITAAVMLISVSIPQTAKISDAYASVNSRVQNILNDVSNQIGFQKEE